MSEQQEEKAVSYPDLVQSIKNTMTANDKDAAIYRQTTHAIDMLYAGENNPGFELSVVIKIEDGHEIKTKIDLDLMDKDEARKMLAVAVHQTSRVMEGHALRLVRLSTDLHEMLQKANAEATS